MCIEETTRESFDNVQYKFLLVPKFRDGMGAIICKTHHCFTDGLGFSTFFLAMSGEYTSSSLPGMKPLPFLKQLLIYLLSPIIIVQATIDILSKQGTFNAIKKNMPFTGRKNGAFSNDLNLAEIKEYTK